MVTIKMVQTQESGWKQHCTLFLNIALYLLAL